MNPYIQNDISMNINNNNPSLQMNQFQSILQLHIMRNFTTGNWMFDTIIQSLLVMMIGFFVTRIKNLYDILSRLLSYFFDNIYIHIKNIYRYSRGYKLKLKKTVEIPYITSTKQINELYKAVNWYLTNNKDIDLTDTTYLEYSFDKKITMDNFESIKTYTNISKIPVSSQSNFVKFKGYDISYQMTTKTITIYTDTEKKKENYIIYLSVEIDNTDKNDILEDFSQYCIHKYIESLTIHKWVQKIFINSDNKWTSQNSNNTRKLDTIILKDELKETIKSDIDLFLNSKEWYMNRDIPYSRGYLFYGLPGTGKTSMIKALSLYCKRHIHFLMLSKVNNDFELLELLKQLNYNDTVLVIEDIDATIESVKSRNKINDESTNDGLRNRKKNSKKKSISISISESESEEDDNIKKNKSGVTLSGLLNAIDGVFDSTGRILIMTTNHPEILDDALIRPGRIDSKYLFDNCDKIQIEKLYEMFFNSQVDKTFLNSLEKVSYSPAHITSVFMRYRNNPEKALINLDNEFDNIKIKSLYDDIIINKSEMNTLKINNMYPIIESINCMTDVPQGMYNISNIQNMQNQQNNE